MPISSRPAQVGAHRVNDETRQTYGHSLICDPWGHKIAMASDAPGFITRAPRSRAGRQGARRDSGRGAAPRILLPELYIAIARA